MAQAPGRCAPRGPPRARHGPGCTIGPGSAARGLERHPRAEERLDRGLPPRRGATGSGRGPPGPERELAGGPGAHPRGSGVAGASSETPRGAVGLARPRGAGPIGDRRTPRPPRSPELRRANSSRRLCLRALSGLRTRARLPAPSDRTLCAKLRPFSVAHPPGAPYLSPGASNRSMKAVRWPLGVASHPWTAKPLGSSLSLGPALGKERRPSSIQARSFARSRRVGATPGRRDAPPV
jgi:hypothetical protein